ncbi:MAG: kdpC [Bacteroidetes bacterium]|nr:kdpC [Bacteroidota bacterium]
MKANIIVSLKVLLAFTVLLGIIYPLAITGFAQLFFPYEANGSIIKINNKPTGSELLGQNFQSDSLFWGRPSFSNYNPLKSGASNFSVNSNSIAILQKKQADRLKMKINNKSNDLLYYSASGLDPHISYHSAMIQADRIAKVRNMDIKEVYKIINKHNEKKQFLFLGEERINVLLLNLDLIKIENEKSK